MSILVLLLPLLSFIILSLCGRIVGALGATALSTSLVGFAAILSFVSFYETSISNSLIHLKLSDWFLIGSLSQTWGFLFDGVTASMLVVILTISFFVHLYSSSYMSTDPYLVRFMSYLSLFTFFMLCLVTSDNFAQMFLGWEGVGLSSYLLINFWFTRLPANRSAIKAVIVNRFGDFSLVISMMIVYSIFRSFDYGLIFLVSPSVQNLYITFFIWELHALSLVSFFLFLGCVGKSAQMGLHTWLPDAMEGPTPVSALIHAATMVTAGVFLLVRFSSVLEFSPGIMSLVTLIGAFTALFAGTVGIFQNDLKRIIAYSTCSQLGYMVLSCGLSNSSLALFHLLNHAFFKALLFLSAGSIIHALIDEQDIRRMGGLLRLLPFSYTCFVIGSLALMGFPYTSGFYSKDFILEVAFSAQSSVALFAYFAGLLAAACTAFYSARLLYLTFLTQSNVKRPSLGFVHEPNGPMTGPLVCLAVFSIFAGYILKDIYIGVGTVSLSNDLVYLNSCLGIFGLNSEFTFASEKIIPVFISILGTMIAAVLLKTRLLHKSLLAKTIMRMTSLKVHAFLTKKWYFDKIYNSCVAYPLLRVGHAYTFKNLDRGLLECFGPSGLVRFFLLMSAWFSKLQTGYLFNYVFAIIVSLVLVTVSTQAFGVGTCCIQLYAALFCINIILAGRK